MPTSFLKSRIGETPTLLTDADSRTDTNVKRLRDLSLKKKNVVKIFGGSPPLPVAVVANKGLLSKKK